MDEMQLLRNIDPVQGTRLDRFPAQTVFEELSAELSLLPPGSPHGPGRTVLGPASSHRWLRRSLLGSVMAAVAAATVVFAVVVPLAGRTTLPNGSYTTAWQPAVPIGSSLVPEPGTEPGAAAIGSFRLVSYLVGSWTVTQGPPGEGGTVTCPTVSACYLVNIPEKANQEDLYFSSDGGTKWSSLGLPNDVHVDELSCPSAEVCAASGIGPGTGKTQKWVFVLTVDGGHRWSVVPMAVPIVPWLMSCSSKAVCTGVSECPSLSGCPTMSGGQQNFVRTTDGGATWYVAKAIPADARVHALSCPTANECIATGDYENSPSSLPSDFAMVSTDGGRHWQRGRLEGSGALGSLATLSCASASTCTAVSVFTAATSSTPFPSEPGQQSSPLCPPTMAPWHDGAGCPTLDPNVATTIDGGKLWTVRPLNEARWTNLPYPLGTLSPIALACSTNDECGPYRAMYLAGTAGGMLGLPELVVQLSCRGVGQCWLATPWRLLSTSDDGQVWSAPQLPEAAARTSQGAISGVSTLSCPKVGQCLALGYGIEQPVATSCPAENPGPSRATATAPTPAPSPTGSRATATAPTPAPSPTGTCPLRPAPPPPPKSVPVYSSILTHNQ